MISIDGTSPANTMPLYLQQRLRPALFAGFPRHPCPPWVRRGPGTGTETFRPLRTIPQAVASACASVRAVGRRLRGYCSPCPPAGFPTPGRGEQRCSD